MRSISKITCCDNSWSKRTECIHTFPQKPLPSITALLPVSRWNVLWKIWNESKVKFLREDCQKHHCTDANTWAIVYPNTLSMVFSGFKFLQGFPITTTISTSQSTFWKKMRDLAHYIVVRKDQILIIYQNALTVDTVGRTTLSVGPTIQLANLEKNIGSWGGSMCCSLQWQR